MTIELARQIFIGATIEVDKTDGAFIARYRGHAIVDQDLMRLAQRLWQSNA